ncbi:AzlC family ABC transporter permease [Rhodobacteraceae bacterium]|nr:AzlC family ABC transporter permease [Paracoccaceae bacterium]
MTQDTLPPLRTSFLRGCRASLPFVLVILPFGLLFGATATEAGFNMLEVLGFSFLVIAGASQFTALQLMSDQASTIMVIITSLAVNLRMAMYSASLAPYLGRAPRWQHALIAYFLVDQVYAVSVADYETHPQETLSHKLAVYAGAAFAVVPFWYISTVAGAVLGRTIPPEFALDFAIPITFLAMIAPALRTFAHVAAALVSVTVSLLLAFLPVGSGLLVAASCAMVTGAQVEKWQTRRRAR